MWKIKETERVLDSEYVKVDKDDVLLPHGREIKDFYKVTIKDCAAIVALTPSNQIILKKEYRHCYGEELIEIVNNHAIFRSSNHSIFESHIH